MSALRATLFETLRLYTEDGRPLDLGSPTTRSLVSYLLLNRSRPVERRRLAFLFWPRASESAARRNLRQYLHHVRTALAPLDPQGNLLQADGSTLQFNPQVEYTIDVETFLHETRPEASLDEMKHALSLYTGDLLEDLYDEWCIPERDRLRQIWLGALDRYSLALQSAFRLNEALDVAQKWALAEPFDETAHRRLMSLYALTGNRARAIQTYQAFAQTLERELQTEPLPETQALFQSIQDGKLNDGIEPTPASFTVRRVPQQKAASLPPALPFVGRQVEITRLEETFRLAQAGQGRLVLITGEAGIGKTRLLKEYLARHSDISSLHSACYELDSMIPFAPLRQALDAPFVAEILRAESQMLPAWAIPLISFLPKLAKYFPYAALPSGPADGLALREALVNLLLHISETCQRGPLHLILDDLHWADSPTWELLALLTRRVMSMPLLILGLCRLEDLPAERLPLLRAIQRSDLLLTIDLPRLSQIETAELAHHLTAAETKNSLFLERLYHETEGNPFFVIETVRALQEAGSGWYTTSSTSLPHSIQRVIEARLDRLDPHSREALACAAAIGRSFTFPLLQEILGDSGKTLISFVEEWLQRGLIYEDKQGYDFRHDKFRQVLYAGLSRARREFIHGKIANVLELAIPPADVITLAYHYARSNQPLKALPYLTQAGEQALRLRSYHEARQFGLQAVNLLGQLPGPRQRSERIDVNLQLAQAYAFTGNIQRAIEILNETERLATALGDEQRLGQIFRRAAQFFWLGGQPETANDYAHRSLRVAEELGDAELLEAALRMLGRVSIALAAFDDAIAYLLRYVNLHDENVETGRRQNRPADLPIVLGYLGVAYSRVGAWERAIAVSKRGLAMAEASAGGNPDASIIFARMQLAMVKAGLHRWDECLQTLSPLPEPSAIEEMTPPLYMALSLRGLAQAQSGETETGTRTLRWAIGWAEQVGHRVFHYLPHLFLAESLLLRRQIEAALEEVNSGIREAQRVGDRWAVGIALRLQADISARLPTPNWPRIETALIESMHLLRQIRARPDLARTYLSLRRLYDRAGQMAWAVDCHFRATTIFDELGMDEELRSAQGQAARERRGAVVIPNLSLKGPNVSLESNVGK